MKWLLKAGVQKGISCLPYSTNINYLFQKLRGGFPVKDSWFIERVGESLKHMNNLLQFRNIKPGDLRTYEFGAGWDLIQPLTYAGMGIMSQYVIDISFNLKLDLVNHTICQFVRNKKKLQELYGVDFQIPETSISSVQDLEKVFKIKYEVQDARKLNLKDESVDFVSSTATFEHIPKDDLALILAETNRVLKPKGVVSCHIDLTDHYSHLDKSISPYNFLKFSPSTFSFLNSRIHYQNRLRFPDYERLIKNANFKILNREIITGNQQELAELKELKLHDAFNSYSLDELAIKVAWLTFQKVD